jgi:predicted nucleic acid-binding protein
MTAPVFVDTNVFVYARQAKESIKQPLAAAWIESLWCDQLGRTSIQVLGF